MVGWDTLNASTKSLTHFSPSVCNISKIRWRVSSPKALQKATTSNLGIGLFKHIDNYKYVDIITHNLKFVNSTNLKNIQPRQVQKPVEASIYNCNSTLGDFNGSEEIGLWPFLVSAIRIEKSTTSLVAPATLEFILQSLEFFPLTGSGQFGLFRPGRGIG